MRTQKVVRMIVALGFVWVMQGCVSAGTNPQQWIEQKDHASLANYYGQEAQRLSEKAKHWMDVAEFYEKHPDVSMGKLTAAEHAAHCRAIAEDYKKAAAEADALATEHRQQRPHGMVN